MRGILKEDRLLDEVFWKIADECNWLLLPLIDEVFDEDHRGDEQIVRSRKSRYVDIHEDGTEKWVSNMIFAIAGEEDKKYTVDCQTLSDGTVLLRMVQFVTRRAPKGPGARGDLLQVTIPNSAVFFLRCQGDIPYGHCQDPAWSGGKRAPLEISTVLGMGDYSLRDLYHKGLYILLPFYIAQIAEGLGEGDAEGTDRMRILGEALSSLRLQLDEKIWDGVITPVERNMIMQLSEKVICDPLQAQCAS